MLWVCDSRFGNCTDFHSLFISLARSRGLPARFEIGLPLPSKRGEGNIGGYHCWALFHHDQKGWVPVDISEADKHPEMKEYYFGNLTENRVTFTTGRDINLVPKQDGGPLNFFVYPYVEVNGKPLAQEQDDEAVRLQRHLLIVAQSMSLGRTTRARQFPASRCSPGTFDGAKINSASSRSNLGVMPTPECCLYTEFACMRAMTANLSWYDLPEVRHATDALWSSLARQFRLVGLTDVPRRLNRRVHYEDQWTSPHFLFGQACGYDVRIAHAGRLRVVAAPCYDVSGCEGSSYSSFVVVREGAAIGSLEDLRAARCVINTPTSHSGMNVLRALVRRCTVRAVFSPRST